MTGLPFVIVLASLAGVVALVHAGRLLSYARAEFRGRLRDLALRRAQHLMVLALGSTSAVAAMVGYAGWPSGAAPVTQAHAAPTQIGRNLQLAPMLTSVSTLGQPLPECAAEHCP